MKLQRALAFFFVQLLSAETSAEDVSRGHVACNLICPKLSLHDSGTVDDVLSRAMEEQGPQIGTRSIHRAEAVNSASELKVVRVGLSLDRPRFPDATVDGNEPPADLHLISHEPTFLERNAILVLALSLLAGAEACVIIFVLVLNRRRRRLRELIASERLELAHLSRRTQVGELSGALAHELSQPLTSILANAEVGRNLCREERVDIDQIKAVFDDIIADDRRATAVIADLRRMLQKGSTDMQPVDLNEIVEGALAIVRAELLVRRTRVDLHLARDTLMVEGNAVQLQQILLNLVMNAIEAMQNMPAAERLIEIRTSRRTDRRCEVSVADYGSGIPAEIRTDLFKPFVTTKQSGVGLGLAICKTIAEAHGGRLSFDTASTKGARAVLLLPPAN